MRGSYLGHGAVLGGTLVLPLGVSPDQEGTLPNVQF